MLSSTSDARPRPAADRCRSQLCSCRASRVACRWGGPASGGGATQTEWRSPYGDWLGASALCPGTAGPGSQPSSLGRALAGAAALAIAPGGSVASGSGPPWSWHGRSAGLDCGAVGGCRSDRWSWGPQGFHLNHQGRFSRAAESFQRRAACWIQPRAASMAAVSSGDSGSTRLPKRASTVPSRPTKNFSKFQPTSPAGSVWVRVR